MGKKRRKNGGKKKGDDGQQQGQQQPGILGLVPSRPQAAAVPAVLALRTAVSLLVVHLRAIIDAEAMLVEEATPDAMLVHHGVVDRAAECLDNVIATVAATDPAAPRRRAVASPRLAGGALLRRGSTQASERHLDTAHGGGVTGCRCPASGVQGPRTGTCPGLAP